MRTTTLWIGVVLGGSMLGMVRTAAATDHGFYAVVDGGLASYPSDLGVDLSQTIYKRATVKNEDFAWSFTAGYRFNEHIAVEGGFVDLGHFHSKLLDASGATNNEGKFDFAARGKTLALVAHAPFGNWDPYFKVGAIYATVNLTAETRAAGRGFSFGGDGYDTRLLAGVGTRYAYTDRWAFSFAVDYYSRLGTHGAIRSTNVVSPRIGFAYRF